MIVRVFFNRMVYSITIPGHVCWGIVILCQVCSAILKAARARVCAPAPGTVFKLRVMFGVAGPMADALPTAAQTLSPPPPSHPPSPHVAPTDQMINVSLFYFRARITGRPRECRVVVPTPPAYSCFASKGRR